MRNGLNLIRKNDFVLYAYFAFQMVLVVPFVPYSFLCCFGIWEISASRSWTA